MASLAGARAQHIAVTESITPEDDEAPTEAAMKNQRKLARVFTVGSRVFRHVDALTIGLCCGMRWTIWITVVLVALLAAYTVWPLVALYQLAGAIENRETAALNERIDLPRLRRSLTEQIVAEYFKLTGKAQRLGPLGTGVAVGIGATVADPVVERLLNLESLVDFLNKGSVSGIVAGANLPSGLAPFHASSLSSAWRTWLNTEYSSTRFWVSLPPDKPVAQQFRAKLELIDWRWKLTGVELPEQLRVQLAQEVIRTNPPSS